jgi:hypothetical protein
MLRVPDKTPINDGGQPARAAIYIPHVAEQAEWVRRCHDAVRARGYDLRSWVADGERPWREVAEMATGCTRCGRDPVVDVIVVPKLRLLDAHRIPRLEEAS